MCCVEQIRLVTADTVSVNRKGHFTVSVASIDFMQRMIEGTLARADAKQ